MSNDNSLNQKSKVTGIKRSFGSASEEKETSNQQLQDTSNSGDQDPPPKKRQRSSSDKAGGVSIESNNSTLSANCNTNVNQLASTATAGPMSRFDDGLWKSMNDHMNQVRKNMDDMSKQMEQRMHQSMNQMNQEMEQFQQQS